MKTNYLEKLEYNKIIQKLQSYCRTYIGKEKIALLKPSFQKDTVMHLQKETTEGVNLIIRKAGNPITDIPNISLWIKQIESYNTLSMIALLQVASFLKIAREIKEYFYSDENFDLESFPILSDLFSSLYTNKGIEEKVFSVILDEETISDNASVKLSSLRRQSKKLEQDIRDKLNNLIHSNTYAKYIMDPIVTIRNDRYVIPVKEEYKSQIKGFIHDISSSGSTVFIEPMNIFELNNQIANLKIEENIEIEKILQQLSSLLYNYPAELINNIEIIASLDIIFAKSSYSIELDGVEPDINNHKQINLMQVKHPLISSNCVVPIDISIGEDYRSLVITGPNTGGKTVTLKTVGLILLMAYSGMYIPCKEGSTIYVFDNIYADIGDEQSIQESLSTFSSHMSNIIEITNEATSHSLILLDELGSGTDPIEGANLAISILQYFYEKECTTICTTHYQELKNYCLLTEGFENASCEFDVEKLQPTYKLLIGIPGKSNAFAISKKLGLNPQILAKANSLMKENDISIEELMKSIYDDKILIEKEKEEIQKNEVQITALRKSLENEKERLKEKETNFVEKAKTEAREILLSAKTEANEIIRELTQLEKGQSKEANRLRNRLNEKLDQVDSSSDNSLDIQKLKELNEKFSLKNNKKQKQQSHSSVTFTKNDNFKSQNISSEINVIGCTVDEALFIIDKYIDDCAIAKLSPIRIVHGKGTGKLRQGIHTYLKTNPHVVSYRLGTFGEGEMGVTVIELK